MEEQMAKKRRSWEDYQKKKIKRGQSGAPIVILLVLLVIACAGLGVVAWVCLRPVTLPHVQPDQASSIAGVVVGHSVPLVCQLFAASVGGCGNG